jgi:hypothetical protein
VALEVVRGRFGDVCQEGVEIGPAGRADVAEGGRIGASRVEAIEYEEVEVNIEVDRTFEILNEGDRAGLGALAGDSGLLDQPSRDAPIGDAHARFAPQLGQKPRPLQLNATSFSS